ncbi:ABC transporter permease [Nocardioides rotundus]|uniref:ABC transporter permease n=1 Tax=Nocardioides rotundus TaxID=1774216 RepID=UPI001CBFB852|nr:ABC transporter permease [Nocardioides rotundus]UAL28986.1 ABC transporter permease [Nocardioides rotundus]
MSTATATPEVADDRVRSRSLTTTLLGMPGVGALIGAIAVAIIFSTVAPKFRQIGNIDTILYQSSTLGIMAIFVAMLMIGGEFDLSTGVAVTASSLTAAHATWYLGLNVWVGVLLALVFSLAVGAFNGWLLHLTGLPSFLVTLGTYFVLTGINLAVTRLVTGGVSSKSISDMDGYSSAAAVFASPVVINLWFNDTSLSLNVSVFYWIVLTILLSWVLLRTRAGNWIFASGGDPAAARAVGVPVVRTKTLLFMGTGFAAWVVGMHNLFQYSTVQSGQGVGYEFIYIIAAVIGGCLLTGGYGSVVGAALGALIYAMTNLGITYAGWDVDWLKTFLGVMLIGAVLVNMWVKKRAEAL